MARGNASVPAMEMTKWSDNYLFIVPELGPDVKFSYASHKAVTEYKEAKAGDFPEGKYLFAGVVDGRDIWANKRAASLRTLETLEGIEIFSANAATQASRKSSPQMSLLNITNYELNITVSI